MVLLTVALLGGLRVRRGRPCLRLPAAAARDPGAWPALLMALFVRGGLVRRRRLGVGGDRPAARERVAHVLTLAGALRRLRAGLQLGAARAGPAALALRRSSSSGRSGTTSSRPSTRARLLRSLAVLFGTAFVLKHMLLAGLRPAETGWVRRVAAALLQGVSLGTLDVPAFAPATGYISFFTIALYVGAADAGAGRPRRRARRSARNSPEPRERARLREDAEDEAAADRLSPAPPPARLAVGRLAPLLGQRGVVGEEHPDHADAACWPAPA